jgi:hypothetical protein
LFFVQADLDAEFLSIALHAVLVESLSDVERYGREKGVLQQDARGPFPHGKLREIEEADVETECHDERNPRDPAK